MCGIAGYVGWPSTADRGAEQLARMCASIRHRGPNDEGQFVAPAVGLSMRRLSVIDVEGGAQPLANEDESVWIVFNGEIYNHRDLRPRLLARGHTFATNSDTECLVHLYEDVGDRLVHELRGMFAFALWDVRRQRLLVARDRLGIKPLYYWEHGGGLAFASELRAFLALPNFPRTIDPTAIGYFLTLGYVPDPLAVFAGVRKLPPGHTLSWDRERGAVIERYWSAADVPEHAISEREAVEEFDRLFTEAVRYHLESDVPLGAFLSGGIDSSSVVAHMARMMDRPVRTFSIGFDERHFSETRYARQIATRYGTDHHEFIFRPDDLVRVIEGVIGATDEPFADPAALPLYELARQTRRHVTVALTGDGGDETLAGYRRYALDGLLRPYSALPAWLTQRAVPAAAGLLPEPSWIPEDRNPFTGIKRLGQFSAVTPKASLARWGSYFSDTQKWALYTDEWRDAIGSVASAGWVAAAYDEARASSLLDRTLYADHVTYLAGDLLPKTDRTTMAHSVESRAPFLDAAWVEWTARLPERYKVRGLKTKWLLTAAFGDKLPPEIATRGKQGFGVPVGHWLRHELRDWARERLIGNPALNAWFRPAQIQRLLDEHNGGRVNHGKRLWALLMFGVWQERSQELSHEY